MPIYEYKGLNAKGKSVSGVIPSHRKAKGRKR